MARTLPTAQNVHNIPPDMPLDIDKIRKEVGALLLKARKSKKLSAVAVATALGFESSGTIYNYEKGTRPLAVHDLYRLAALYDVRAEDLLPRTKESENEYARLMDICNMLDRAGHKIVRETAERQLQSQTMRNMRFIERSQEHGALGVSGSIVSEKVSAAPPVVALTPAKLRRKRART
jgi:transcriptional regulator with XRE-family HTH domain